MLLSFSCLGERLAQHWQEVLQVFDRVYSHLVEEGSKIEEEDVGDGWVLAVAVGVGV